MSKNQQMNFSKCRYYLMSILVLLMIGCQKEYKTPEAIERISVDISMKRFDREFAELDNASLKVLKSKFDYLFPEQYPDTFWIKKSNDSIQLALRKEVFNVYPKLSAIETELELFYKHLLFYYPQVKVPEIVAITNDVDYKNSIVQGNAKLIIALDCYLGKEHEFYQNISSYIANNLHENQIIPDVAAEYARKIIGRNTSRDFIGQLIHYGKQLYLTEAFVPFKEGYDIMRYEKAQWEWAEVNEKFMWEYFIDKQILFSTDKSLSSRFLQEAPFTKFYLDFDAETPGRLGQYMGYKIVSAFMKHNKVSLQQLVELDNTYIFEHSKYKPNK